MRKSHLHATAPAKRGRPVPAYMRCVVCSCSTRSTKYVQCQEDNSPGGRICLTCYECSASDKSVFNCHSWVKSANSHALSECGMCAIKTDQLIACIVCDSSICESCCNNVTLMRFFATGAYETICNACIPPEACADPDGLTTKYLGDRKHTFCIICQDWHEDATDGVVDCDIDLHEHSPLARLCIESLAIIKAKTKKSTKRSNVQTPSKEVDNLGASGALSTAREVQRDNMIVDMQLQIAEMEKRLSVQIEKSLNLKMLDLQNTIGVSPSNPTSLDKCVQVDKQELKLAEAHYKAQKAKENPTQAILESLPKILETITSTIEKSYRFKNQNNQSSKKSNPRGPEKKSMNQRPKTNRHGGQNQNSNPRR